MRRLLGAALAAAVVVAWVAVPYGRPLSGAEPAPTFASLLVEMVGEAIRARPAGAAEAMTAAGLGLLGAVVGLSTVYPAVLVLLLGFHRWGARWPRWPWVVLGGVVVLAAPLGALLALLSLTNFAGGASGDPTPAAGLLPGLAVAAGLLSICLGVSRRARARWLGLPPGP